jgi:NADH-quinone oxidoreductase subunit E
MLSEKERNDITSHLNHYAQKRAGCIDALKVIQHHRGWVSDEAIAELAEFFNMEPAELDSVATFYNLIFRKPVGRHVIFTCDSVSCWIMGCEKLQRRLQEHIGITFGETSPDCRFTLLPAPCLGVCEQAPALMIDGEVYGNLQSEELERILENYE